MGAEKAGPNGTMRAANSNSPFDGPRAYLSLVHSQELPPKFFESGSRLRGYLFVAFAILFSAVFWAGLAVVLWTTFQRTFGG